MHTDYDSPDPFLQRHLGPTPAETAAMLQVIGAKDLDDLMDQVVPKSIRLSEAPDLPTPLSERELLQYLKSAATENKTFRSYIGLGYHNTHIPAVIQRNIFENPGWYTQYTPYQAEISQGRLEALINFQTMITELSGMDVANASLLDEGTAAAEAMTMFYRTASSKENRHRFFAAKTCLPQTLEILKSRAEPVGIELVIGDPTKFAFGPEYCGALLQYPDANGAVHDYREFIARAKDRGIRVALAADLMSLCLISSPGELGADVALGSAQRFGTPLGYGGPHAAYFAVRDEFKRQIPGRIIGVSVDKFGRRAYRMSLQTREQHIRREKATSNICTAQALLAIMSGMFGVYHGPDGLRKTALRVHGFALTLSKVLEKMGYAQENEVFFDTLLVDLSSVGRESLQTAAEKREINFRYDQNQRVGIALDETVSEKDMRDIAACFAEAAGIDADSIAWQDLQAKINENNIPEAMLRKDPPLRHEVFHAYSSETALMRYIKSLENRDLALNRGMIPLGSCTMKLNAAAEMMPLSWPEFANIHPFAPITQTQGYKRIIHELASYLCAITGFSGVSLQPNSGAQGEFAGLLVIREYHAQRGEAHRNVALIPISAHGTNPASAVMAGMTVELVRCDESGNIDLEDLEKKAAAHADDLAALMVTYPSTHGVYEEEIRRICEIVHTYGGQVYMDGANMNAQVGLTSPALIGADVCHLNLHKTFAIPHGGGGPGVGPICAAAHLSPFLPGHIFDSAVGGEKAIPAVSAAPYGSAYVLLISYSYIRLLGGSGLTEVSRYAILNANYLKARLEKEYKVVYTGKKGAVAHEMILDFRDIKHSSGISAEDVAKRLMDYGFHAPTMSFPIPGTLMVEPTESEPLKELDRFCASMLSIRNEIREVEDGHADKSENVLCNAPHPISEILRDDWPYSYSRQKAADPLKAEKNGTGPDKYWPPVARIDNVKGDRNLICTCPPIVLEDDQ